MMNRKIQLSLSVLVVLSLLAYVVVSVLNETNIGDMRFGNTDANFYNVSDTIANFSLTIDRDGEGSWPTNVSYEWRLTSNNSVMSNVTVSNISCGLADCANMSVFNRSFDTTSIPDGIYNISVLVHNRSLADGLTLIPFFNGTVARTITVDNTVPNVTNLARNVSGVLSVATSNMTFNLSFKDGFAGEASNLTFNFDNASDKPGDQGVAGFNVTTVGKGATENVGNNITNISNTWTLNYNASNLRPGDHTLRIYAYDLFGNLNRTETLTFSVNTPPNVTVLGAPSENATGNSSGQNFNVTSRTRVWNISVQNVSFGATKERLLGHVIVNFDNGTGKPGDESDYGKGFNVTASLFVRSQTAANELQYWNLSYNVSSLRGGDHTLTIYANDSLGNFNRTQTITFSVNNPMNVTSINVSQGLSFKKSYGNRMFNVSVLNVSFGANAGQGQERQLSQVILMFDNASGNDFNRSMLIAPTRNQSAVYHYWNLTFNVSTLAAGDHVVTIFANDTFGNFNRSVTFSFETDYTPPTVTLSKAATSTTSQLVLTIATDSDSATCNSNVGSVTGSGSSQTLTYTGLGEGTSYSFTVTCDDEAGNSGSATGSFSTDSETSGTGTGGSGGGSSSGISGQFAKTTWASINQGETATVAVDNGEVGITEVSFAAAQTVYGAWVSVNAKESFPSSVADFANKEYKKVEISTGPSLKEGSFEKAAVKFKVEKTWLAENKLEKGAVAMYRYAEGKWNELKTTIGEDDGTYVHYTAETPGFSYFVIGERTGAAVAEPEAEAAGEEAAPSEEVAEGEAVPAEETAAAGEGAAAPSWPWVVVALVVLGVAVAVYLMKKR